MGFAQEPKSRIRRWPAWLRTGVSIVLVLHFGLISLVYFSNNSLSRMPIADNILIKAQPYLIGFGWYTELLPMSVVGSESFDRPVQIEYRTDRQSRTWTAWIDSSSSDARWRRLSQLAGALASNEDEEGFGLIALSLVQRAKSQGLEIDQIRFTVKGSTSRDTMGKESTGMGNGMLYQATVVSLANGELTLVPSIDSTRTVPVTKVQTASTHRIIPSLPDTGYSPDLGDLRGTN